MKCCWYWKSLNIVCSDDVLVVWTPVVKNEEQFKKMCADKQTPPTTEKYGGDIWKSNSSKEAQPAPGAI